MVDGEPSIFQELSSKSCCKVKSLDRAMIHVQGNWDLFESTSLLGKRNLRTTSSSMLWEKID
jgi:hypothetical protein